MRKTTRKNRDTKVISWTQPCTIMIMIVVVLVYNNVWLKLSIDNVRPATSSDNVQFTTSPAQRGVVKGIIYNMKNPTALIDGNIAKEGDDINGVTVVKIYKDKVIFKKNRKQWEQRVHERPNPAWDGT